MIIAIDPGTRQSAMLVWDGVVGLPCIDPNEAIRERLIALSAFQPTATLAIEMIACYGMSVGAETFETCLFIGRIQEIWLSKGLKLKLVYRRDVKMHLCGTMKAKDANIRQALIDRFGPVGTKKKKGLLYGIKSDLWSALAVAIYASDTMQQVQVESTS